MYKKIRRTACVCLTAVMAVSLAASNALALAQSDSDATVSEARPDTVSFENVTGKIDLSSVVLQNLSSSVLENAGYAVQGDTRTVIVTLDGDPIIDSMPQGEVAGEYVTSYEGAKKLRSIRQEQTNFLNSLSSLGVEYTVKYQYSTVTNAVAIEVNTAYLSTIKSIASVKTAVVSETYAYPETVEYNSSGAVSNPSNVYETGIYDSSEYVAQGLDGSGMTVAILDTGLDYTHEAFSVMPETVSMDKSYVAERIASQTFNSVQLSKAAGKNITADDLYINAKVPYAYDYADSDTDVYPSYSQHGTHVAGIVASEADSYTDKDGNVAKDADGNILSFRGVAPKAQLVICKVFTDDLESEDIGGATSEDIMAALEDCVLLGVDIINMSLGTTAGFSTMYIDGDDEGIALANVYTSIKEAGISLICAASNDYSSGYGSAFGTNLASNPESGTVGSPSTFAGAVSVASINGQLSPFMLANGSSAIFYTESSDENSVKYDFIEQMLSDGQTSRTFKYVMVPGIGQAADYTSSIKALLADKSEGKVIAVIKRGTSTFQDKVEIAQRMGADAVIIYNNVAGTVGMSLGDLEDPIPAVSVSMDAGRLLAYDENGNQRSTGYIEVNTAYQAGPFMNDYSSWGSTPDLKLKPEITSHGGEITSTVSGGYSEMSGTSMASPNLAGFVALLRGYLKQQYPDLTATELTQFVNQILMSTATTVYDSEGLPYSPRKQGAGLATLSSVFTTQAYLLTYEDNGGAEDNRPKIELGEDENKTGVYELEFYVHNFGANSLTFSTETLFFTETLSSDGLSVAEKAYMFGDIDPVWEVNGAVISADSTFTVPAGEEWKIKVTLTLSDSEKNYIDTSFINGMYVEGFLKLISRTDGQCNLTLPFMGFYGDWESAPLLDYNCYEIAEFQQDTSYTDETRPQASVWATQAYSTYYNNKYTLPMGSFLYLQDETAEQIYVEEEHSAVSCYNLYYGPDALDNYMTSTTIKALYAGLLRNVELITYDLYDALTGEIIKQDCVYRVNKAYAAGGSAVPAQVLLELDPVELGLVANGKYQLDFHFYLKVSDRDDPDKQDNTFSMVFYVDYEAPILVDSRIRYYDYKDGNKDKQKVYLDLDIYDNHYAQSVLLCYADNDVAGSVELKMATEYVTPIYNANKNGTTTVSIEITDFYEKYLNRLYIQIDDYALNHNIYQISFSTSTSNQLPDQFSVVGDKEITIGVNETYKVTLDYEGSANISNFSWTATPQYVAQVKNGEIFGVSEGTATVTVTGKNGVSEKITVHVVASNTELTWPSISFGTIENSELSIVKASGTVKVNAGADFNLEVEVDPWYYPVADLKLVWSSSDESIATVDQNGNVKTLDEEGIAIIKATIMNGNMPTAYTATVTLSVQDPFTVSNYTLTDYHGTGGVVKIPDDENIMTIGEEAFKDNDNIRVIIIPKTVTTISERAFINCTALEEVYFIQEDPMEIADADLSMIMANAFYGCTSLKKVDFSNVKTITIDKEVFYGCTNLAEVVKMSTIGTMNDRAFAGCTSLLSADITGLHTSGVQVFKGCTALTEIKTEYYTAIGEDMFNGCTELTSVTISAPSVSANAFYGCTNLKTVNFDNAGADGKSLVFSIGAMAFYNCNQLTEVNFNGYPVSSIGDMAFAKCRSLMSFTLPAGDTQFGDRVFADSPVTITFADGSGYGFDSFGTVYNGTKLVLAPKTITSEFVIKEGTTEIAAYAFSGCVLDGLSEIAIPETVTMIGEGAFANSQIKKINLPSGVTEIAAYAFYATDLTEVIIPARIKSVGAEAFADCASLASVVFEDNSLLEQIGSGAFIGCTSLTEIVLPDGAGIMGDRVFEGCTNLVSVTLPSVTELGLSTFVNCPSLVTVIYGENSTVTGNYTFYSYNFNRISSLKNVTFGNLTYELGDAVFYNCNALESIDLKNITVIGLGAFANCENLGTVTGLENVTEIGALAFYNCSALTGLDLTSAKVIGDNAFYAAVGSTVLDLPNVVTIGNNAFFGGAETQVNLPATLKSVGYGAFADSVNLAEINVDGENKIYFTEDGVLYRVIDNFVTGKSNTYEVCAYPTAKVAQSDEDGTRSYTLKDGTVSVQAYAFYKLNANAIQKITLPYSVKVIGDAAFYASGISEYVFQSINAPTLLTTLMDTGVDGFYSLFYLNYEDEFISHTNMVSVANPASLKISYPSNGVGYDNYVYSAYFGTATTLGELLDDTTRELIETIEGFVSADTVETWNTLEVNEENKQMVSDFSEQVKEAHRILNTIKSDVQLEYLGEENIAKLYAIEAALKTVKQRFNITVSVASLAIDPDSVYKTEYKAGEAFDVTGIKIIVTYDDYSTETVTDTSLFSLSVDIGKIDALSVLDIYVRLAYNGKSVQIPITVTDGSSQGGSTTDGETKDINPAVIYGPIIGVVVLAAVAVAVVLVLKKKKAGKTESGGETESENAGNEETKEKTSENKSDNSEEEDK